MLLIRASTAPMLIPTSFSGIESNQTMGQSTNASKASGQHNTNRMHQPTRDRSVVTAYERCATTLTVSSVTTVASWLLLAKPS